MDIFSSFSLNRIPILPFTMSAIGGVLLALHFNLPPAVLFWSTAVLFVLALLALRTKIPVRVVGVLSVLFIASLVAHHTTTALDRNVRTAVDGLAEWGGNVELIGNVIYTDDPSDSRSSIVLYNAVLSNDSVEIACNALRIRVLTDTGGMPDLQFGDLVFTRGKLKPSAAYSPVSVGSIIGSLTRQEAAAMRAKPRDIVVQRKACWDIRRTVDRVRAYIIRTFNASLSPDGAALCKALVLGERSDFSHEFNDELRITGLSHLFALSGMNVGFLAGALWLLLAIFYIPRGIRLWILLLTVFFYMLLGREAPSLVRASIMASCLVVGHLLYRQPRILNTVAAAAFIELLWRPLDLIDAGFLLSYLAVIGILGGYSLVREHLLRVWNKPCNAAVLFGSGIVATTAGAQIGTIPLVGFLFGRMPLVGALGNIIAVPGFAVLMLWSVLLLVIHATVPLLTPYVAGSINALSYLLGKLVEVFASLPFASIFVPEFSIIVLILAYVGIAIFATGFALKKFRWILTGLLIVANLTIWGAVSNAKNLNSFLSFISVGNGDAILASDGDCHILIDSGPAFGEWSAADRIVPFLAERNIKRLNAIVLTHPDNDHIGGTQELLRRIPVRRIFSNGQSSSSRTFLDLKLTAAAKDIPWTKLQAGDRIHYGTSGVMEVLSPDSLLLTQLTTENAKSLVIKLSGCGADAILAADIDSLTEQSLLAWDVCLEAELLKIAHHGSKSSTCERLLDAVSPEIAVISAGPLNRFSHPHPSVLARLTEHHIAVYSTVRNGSLTFSNRNGRWNYIESPARKLIRQWKLDHV